MMPYRKDRRGGVLLHTFVALLLIASVLLTALALGVSRTERAANKLQYRQLTMLSESIATQALWKLNHASEPLPQEEMVFMLYAGPEGQEGQVLIESQRPGWVLIKAEASLGANQRKLQLDCLVLDERFYLDHSDHLVVVSDEPVIDVSALTPNRQKAILLVGQGGNHVQFNSSVGPAGPLYLENDLHLCRIGAPFTSIRVSSPLVVAGRLILEGDCFLEKPLRAEEVFLLGNISIEGEGLLEAQTIYCTSMPNEDIQDLCIGDIVVLPEDGNLDRRVYVFDLNHSRR